MRISLKQVNISNFRDIGVNQSFLVPTNAVCTVVGQNKDNGGSNGSGKTSLILSDKVALFGASSVGLTTKDSKNRHNSDKPTSLSAVLDVNGKELVVDRTIGGKLTAQFDGAMIDGKADDVQEKIVNLMGLSPEHFMYLTYREQGSYGGFLRMKDSEKKEFLGVFLNLSSLEKAQESIKAKSSKATDEMKTLSSRILFLKENAEQSQVRVDSMLKDISSQEFSTKKASIDEYKIVIQKIKEDVQQVDSEIAAVKSRPAPYDLLNRVKQIDLEISSVDSKRSDKIKTESKIKLIASQMQDLKNRQSYVAKNICYACKQEIHNQDTAKLAQDVDGQISSLTVEANQLYVKLQDLQVLPDTSVLLNQKSHILVEIQSQSVDKEVRVLNERRSQLLMNSNAMSSALSSAQQYIDSVAKNLEAAKSQVNKYLSELDALEGRLSFVVDDVEILSYAEKVLSRGGFIGHIFDRVLDEMNYEVNKNIQMIPNIRHLYVTFKPDKMVKSTGNISKEITCEIKDGQDQVSLGSLSGGEQRSLSIAVDEALDTILSRRLGVYVGYKFLDEPFDAIDYNSKEALLEFFKFKSADKTYLLVDHASEFNAAVDSRLIVIKQNGVATINAEV
jgi:DNA repair exonuclease SbcCD ATPase subunit